MYDDDLLPPQTFRKPLLSRATGAGARRLNSCANTSRAFSGSQNFAQIWIAHGNAEFRERSYVPRKFLLDCGRHFGRVGALRTRSIYGSNYVEVSKAGLNRRIGVRVRSHGCGVQNRVRAARRCPAVDVVPDYVCGGASCPRQTHRMR